MDRTVPTASASSSAASTLRFATALPCALLIGGLLAFSALVDPLVNFGYARAQTFGGIELDGQSKTRLAGLIIPCFALVAMVAACLAPPRFPARLMRVAAPALLFLAMALASAAWSRGAGVTFEFAIYQIVLFGSLVVFVTVGGSPKRILDVVLALFAVVVLVNGGAVALREASDIGHTGIYQFKNSLGAAAGCAFLVGLFAMFEGGWLRRSVALFTTLGALLVAWQSESKTALALMLLAPSIAVAIWLAVRVLRIGAGVAFLLFAAIGSAALLLAVTVAASDSDGVLGALFGDVTFTGRTDIWSFALDYAWQSPLLGNGYRGFWALGLASPKHGSEIEFIRTIGSGHSGFVDTFLDLGLVGLLLLLGFIVAAFRMAGRFELRPASRSLFYVSVLLFVAGRNVMESVILWSSTFDNLLFLLVALLCAYREPQPAR